ncbi:MAG: hypothetical protein JSU98_11650 [Gemmatimonadales bacterium]|jgi:hypothetical protein|nr:MAG: hypothetical protein JSU98_11650 [Gemmatimonadales bacterium]
MNAPGHNLRVALLTGLAVLISGCATNRFPGQSPSAIITVNNEHSVLNHVTVYLVPSLGTPVRLGTVDLNDSRNFTIRRGQLSGTYRLWARQGAREGFYSPEFTLAERDVVEWDLRMNHVFLLGTTDGG